MKLINVKKTSENIKQYMSARNITVKDIAVHVSVSDAAVYKWLNAKGVPSVESARALADLFGLEYIEEIFLWVIQDEKLCQKYGFELN